MRIQLLAEWVARLQGWPEAGMGYHLVDATFADGRVLPFISVWNGEWLDVPETFADAVVTNLVPWYPTQL